MSKKRFECEYNWIIDNNKINTNESLIVYDEECNTLDDLCELLNKQNQKISDLESKLAESEKKYEDRKQFCISEIRSQTELINNLLEENEELKQQLAEKDAEIRVAYSFRKQKCDNLQKALAEKEEEFMQVVKDWKSLVESKNQDKISFAIAELEKVKELTHNRIKEIVNDLSEEDDERLNQKHTIHGLATAITDIDNQIAELKKGVE